MPKPTNILEQPKTECTKINNFSAGRIRIHNQLIDVLGWNEGDSIIMWNDGKKLIMKKIDDEVKNKIRE